MGNMLDTSWSLPLKRTTQNKRAKRTGVPFRASHELIGFDGDLEGGLRPFPGFKHVVDLTRGFGAADKAGGQLRGFFPFVCNVDDATFAYGYVYRVEGESGNAGNVQHRLVFRIGNDSVWQEDATTQGSLDGVDQANFNTGLIGSEAFDSEPLHLETVGRFNYVFRKGLEPFMFYFTCESSGQSSSSSSSCDTRDYSLKVLTDLGPGPPPDWQQTEPHTCEVSTQAAAATSSSSGIPDGPVHPDMIEVLTEMTVPATVPAEARVLYFGFSELELEQIQSTPAPIETNDRLNVRNFESVLDQSHPLSTLDQLRDETETPLWAAPPFTDPEFEVIGGVDSIYNPANFVDGSIRGYPDADMGGMLWAYRLWDSRTGRFSALSETREIVPDEFGACPEVQVGDPDEVTEAVTTFPMFQIIYDAGLFDTLMLFRGTPAGDLDPEQTVLSLEAQVKLETYHIDNFPAGAGAYKVAAYFPVLTNDALALQPKFDESLTFLEDMPRAGSAIHFEGALLLGNFGTNAIEDAGLSTVRWSSLFQISVELFDPAAKYQLLTPTDDVERYERAGPNIWGLSRVSHYLFRKEGTFMKVFPMHDGYGIVNPRAATKVGSTIYLTTPHGIKTIKPAGELADITVANSIIKDEWSDNLENVEMAFDTHMGLIVALNPDLEEMWLAWLETSMTTGLHDCTFKHVIEGLVPKSPLLGVGETNPLEKRAVFVSQVEIEPVAEGVPVEIWRVWVIDWQRENTGVRFLGHTGTAARFSAVVGSSSSSSSTVSTAIDPGFIATQEMNLEGAYLYVLDGTHEGDKAKVRFVDSNGNLVLSSSLAFDSGDRIGISPVYCRWVGHQLGLQAGEELQQFSFGNDDDFRVRQPEQLGCHFVDVTGDPATDTMNKDARFKALVFKGNDSGVLGSGFPLSINGKTDAERKYLSVIDGPSEIYASFGDLRGQRGSAVFPGVEITCPDLDFTLLSVKVDGKITGDDREDRPRVE